MLKKIKKGRISKRTNRKQALKKFIESGYNDLQAFYNACKNDENLLIYTCLTKEEVLEYIKKMQEFPTIEEQIKFLINNQPIANENVERFDRVTESIANYLKGYIEFNGWKMNNGAASAEDWTAEFWAKYCKICNFYRMRWFFPEKLKKESTVKYTPILYKEFIYLSRRSISGERKHRAFLASLTDKDSIFKVSLDSKIDSTDNDKTLGEVISLEDANTDTLLESANVSIIIEKALSLCKEYPDSLPYYDKIKDFYEKMDPTGFDKKTILLGKIFLYKAGLVSTKTLAFIKSLSTTYKARYNISTSRVNTQLQEVKENGRIIRTLHRNRVLKEKKIAESWKTLIFRKRGEL